LVIQILPPCYLGCKHLRCTTTPSSPPLRGTRPQDAAAAGRKLTGTQLGRAIGRSDRYGRLLLREFRATHPAAGNGDQRHQQHEGAPQ